MLSLQRGATSTLASSVVFAAVPSNPKSELDGSQQLSERFTALAVTEDDDPGAQTDGGVSAKSHYDSDFSGYRTNGSDYQT